jgi:4-amino-4-deoxy-L-arabinose transferase-like glycosyltransferase
VPRSLERRRGLAWDTFFNRERLGLAGLLAVTAILYLWDLGASGWASSFYSAAVEASTKNWISFLFGSFDSSNFITVDKPPASLWVMDLSARLFGVNAWSILVPQALEGVACVAFLYFTVRRVFGSTAAFIAGAAMAATPAAALMFRFNKPDALLLLLLVIAAFAMVRALETGSTSWLALAGLLVGTGFITKMLQAFLVLPAFLLVYLCVGPNRLQRRFVQLLAALVTLIVASGWWVALVTIWPASARPYIGGSQNNSELNLIFGYNGFGRLTGNEAGSVTISGASARSATGWERLFLPGMGGDISWLIPAALIAIVAILWLRWHAPRNDLLRAVGLLWAGCLLVTDATFSLSQGIIHPYYTVALAPAVAALVGIGAALLWRARHLIWARILLTAGILATTWWSWVLLDRVPSWLPWLRVGIVVVGLVAAAGIMVLPQLPRQGRLAVAAVALASCLAGTGAYTVATAAQPHTGSIPKVGPAAASNLSSTGTRRGPRKKSFAVGTRNRGFSGLLNSGTASAALTAALKKNASDYRWVLATVAGQNAAGYQLAADEPVMAIGGFNGTDPHPTLAQFKAIVRAHEIHYFIGADFSGSSTGSKDAEKIAAWVEANFSSTTIGGATVYNLSAG